MICHSLISSFSSGLASSKFCLPEPQRPVTTCLPWLFGNHMMITLREVYSDPDDRPRGWCYHPKGTSIGSDNCDFLKVSDFNGSL